VGLTPAPARDPGADTGRQNPHLTHRANIGAGRHGWLRLTPAYSVRLVRDRLAAVPAGSVITDPFSGSGTTVLAAAEHGCAGQALDVNPFLVWLGNAKARDYHPDLLAQVRQELPRITEQARKQAGDALRLWEPRLHNIGRWWAPGPLAALKALRHVLDEADLPQPGLDLLSIAFCRAAIESSNAAFNHQSMSFRAAGTPAAAFWLEEGAVIDGFAAHAGLVLAAAAVPLPGTGRVLAGDARQPAAGLPPCDLLITSPPYVNRMSYIRELRPYMYWLRFLQHGSEAGELDWQAIGGTWGAATSRVAGWVPDGTVLPVGPELAAATALIRRDGGRNGPLLANYVAKYFYDMARHFEAAFTLVRSGGEVIYVIGNSTFYGHLIPAQDWYAALLRAAGFTGVAVAPLRKRNSKAALYEYEVTATRP
jgi:hypothetical protein